MPTTKPKYDSASLTNLVDADPTPWKSYVLLGVLVFAGVLISAAIYTWHNQDMVEKESQACTALYQAKTADAKVRVADSFPTTDTAPRALILAAQDDYDAGKFTDSLTLNQRVLNDYSASPLKENAELGEAACFEQSGKLDDALRIYLDIARRRSASPYSGLAWVQAVTICQDKNDPVQEGQLLSEALSIIAPTSRFHSKLMDMDARLKTTPPETLPNASLNVPTQAPVISTPSPSPSPSKSAAAAHPTPVKK